MKSLSGLLLLLLSIASAGQVFADATMNYDSGTNTWSVSNWGPYDFGGSGGFAPSSFSGYTSIGGVGMLRNDESPGWWIGEVDVSTYSSFYAPDTDTITVTGATWGGIVPYFSTQPAGGMFYAASNAPLDIIDATGLSLGDAVNGTFSWSGSDSNKQLNFTAIPEPALGGLLGFSLLGVGFIRRRK